jgi:hypothetical protein
VTQFLQTIFPLFLGLVVLLAVIRWIMSRVRNRLDEAVRLKFAGRTIVRQSIGANFFGRLSHGVVQIRGNGALVLTQKELYFLQAVPRREITIPLEVITAVTTPRSHLGKSVILRLLRVDFREAARADAIAWALHDVDSWKADIERYQPHQKKVKTYE